MMNMISFFVFLLIWSAAHSFFASHTWKDWLEKRVGQVFMQRYYRFWYNFFSLVTILPAALIYISTESKILYSVEMPWKAAMLAGQAVGLLLMGVAVLQTGFWRFVGLEPQADLRSGEMVPFVTSGLYSLMRHPIYSGTYLLLICDPTMTEVKLMTYLIFAIYVFIGIYFEERRLTREFGDLYHDYKARVPMLIPGLKRKQYDPTN